MTPLGYDYVPAAGQSFLLDAPFLYPSRVFLVAVDGDKARIAIGGPNDKAPPPYSIPVPTAAVRHLVNDLNGVVYAKAPSKNRLVNEVLAGRGKLLGKGDDGVVFRVGASTVKVSTVVPYQPMNPGYLTPRQAVERMLEQHRVSEAMRRSGVLGVLPTTVLIHEDKAYTIRPYVEIPERLTAQELAEVAASVESAHRLGWVFRDHIQVGRYKGALVHFDLGKAARATPDPRGHHFSDEASDIQALKSLFREHGAVYLTAAEKVDPIRILDNLIASNVPARMTPEEKKLVRRKILELDLRIKAYVKHHPGAPEVGLWADPEFHREEIRDAMKRYAV